MFSLEPRTVEIEPTTVETTIGRLLAAQAQRRARAPAVVFSGGSPITYASLLRQAQAIGTKLRAAGVRADDRVAVVLPNGPGMAVAFVGVASAAACAPLNPMYTAAEFDFYLTDLDARAVVVPAGVDSPVREVARQRGAALLEYSHRDGPEGRVFELEGSAAESQAPHEEADPQSVALILHTSGTTSRPKMIRLTHANVCASAAHIRATLELDEQDRCLNVMPLFHIHGLMAGLLAPLASGGSVACSPGFSPVSFYAWLEEFEPTWYTAVPTMHQEVLARAAANKEIIARCRLRFIRSSSASLSPDLMSGLEQAFDVPVIEAFGMTEASHQIASNPLPPAARKPASVGLPAGCEVTILDERGQTLPRGESGEIAIRGPSVTRFQPAAGNGAAGGAAPSPADAGWFRTGDVGHIDEDGYVFISGRIKEMINRGGEKIAPNEVDYVLQAHPDVGQAVVCAVPDPRLGEDVVAVVVRRPGSTLTERELREFASTQLAAFKVPRRVMFVDTIPKGPTGKIQRIGLAKKLGIESLAFAQPGESASFEAPRSSTELLIASAWSEALGIDRVGLHDNFFELGGDSLMAVAVITQVQARMGVMINIRDMGFGTLQQVAAGCDEAAAGANAPGRPEKHHDSTTEGWMSTTTASVRRGAGTVLRAWTRPLVKMRPVEDCPGWLATLHNIKVPGNVEPNPYESPNGSANIKIMFRLLDSVLPLQGDIAECGVWQGSALIPTAMYVRPRAPAKRVFGFDSFEGLDETVAHDVELGGDDDERRRVGGFSNTSYAAVRQRVRQFDLSDTVTLVRGYFQHTLPQHADSQFCFVHLDCVIYESYRACLEFFYPRMVKGGIILLDEYKDSAWPGCTQACDEFMADKPEQIIETKSDEHLKYYFCKL